MNQLFKRWSLMPQGLRYKLLVAFCLMSIIPLLVLGYIVTNFILLQEEFLLGQVSTVVLISILIAWLGLVLAKKLIDPVIDLSIEAKMIAGGEFDRRVNVETEDEIGELGQAINLLTRRIKDNIHELRDYSEKTKEINIEIQQKVLALSNILQIGDLISASVELDNILDLVLDKVSQLYDHGFGCVFLSREDPNEYSMKSFHNLEDNELLKLKFRKGEGFLGQVIKRDKTVVIDAGRSEGSEGYEFKTKFRIENAVIIPLAAAKQVRGLFMTGNFIKNFTYTSEDVDMIKIFAKQLSIGVENDALLRKAESLAIKDDLTNLYNNKFIRSALQEEIKRAMLYQRPCSFIIFTIDDFRRYRDERGELAAENALRKISDVLRKHAAPIGKAGRMEADEFSLVLPEKNKKEAMSIATKVNGEIGALRLSDDSEDRITVSAGASENPIDGATADDIFNKARHNVLEAKSKGKSIVVG